MTLREVLVKTIGIICDDDIDLDIESKKRKKLLDCANTIYQELVELYIDLKNKEKIIISDGKILYSTFSKRIKDILSIYKNGIKQTFRLYPLFIEIEEKGEVDVKYTYLPENLSLEDDLVLPPPYTENMLAMGIASEYFYRSGLIDEAIFYKNRFDNALLNLSRKRSSFELKKRSFLWVFMWEKI